MKQELKIIDLKTIPQESSLPIHPRHSVRVIPKVNTYDIYRDAHENYIPLMRLPHSSHEKRGGDGMNLMFGFVHEYVNGLTGYVELSIVLYGFHKSHVLPIRNIPEVRVLNDKHGIVKLTPHDEYRYTCTIHNNSSRWPDERGWSQISYDQPTCYTLTHLNIEPIN